MRAIVLLDGSISNDARVMRQLNTVAEIAEVHLFSIEKKDFTPPVPLNSKVNITPVRYPDNLRQKLVKHTFVDREYDFLFKEVQKRGEKYDVCIANDLPALRTGLLLKRKGIVKKLYYDAHEISTELIKQFFPGKENMSFSKKMISGLLTRFMIKHAMKFECKGVQELDGMMTVNDSLAQYFSDIYSIPKPVVIRSIPQSKNKPSTFFDFKSHFGWSKETRVFLYQGVLDEGRGVGPCIDALATLDPLYKIVVIGEGVMRLGLEKQAQEKQLSERVKFLGFVKNSELSYYTNGADVGLCMIEPTNLSKKLSLPNKIFEYMLAGIPILGSDNPEIKQIVEEYNLGVVSVIEPEAIAKKMISIFDVNYASSILEAQKTLNWDVEKKKILGLIQ